MPERGVRRGGRALPSSLLLLSRAFTVTQPFQTPKPTAAYDSLKETLGALPNKARPRPPAARPGAAAPRPRPAPRAPL